MVNSRIACQTITFGETQRDHFKDIFPIIARSGFEGVEIGFRHVKNINPEALYELMSKNRLQLVASHIGGNLAAPAQANSERQILDIVLDYLEKTKTGYLMYSGLRVCNQTQLDTEVAMLNQAAMRSRERDIQMLYHNHNWEFENDGTIMESFLSKAVSELKLCPDLGWIHKAGVDVMAFLEKYIDRIAAIHFKDFASREPVLDTVCLGTGCVPLREAAEWLKNNTTNMWMISEQDKHDGDPAGAIHANATFLQAVFE